MKKYTEFSRIFAGILIFCAIFFGNIAKNYASSHPPDFCDNQLTIRDILPEHLSYAEGLRDIIRCFVEYYALHPPQDIDACVTELTEQRTGKNCQDGYAQRYYNQEREPYLPIKKMMRGNAGILTIYIFQNNADIELTTAIEDLISRGAKKLYLDLRNSNGGSVEGTLKLLYLFARKNDFFTAIRFRQAPEEKYDAARVREEYELKNPPGALRGIPTIVIIGPHSASAAEIFAGAMKDWGYPVAGARSFGKGTGQMIIPLADGSILKLSAFEYFVGNARTKIQGVGVAPNAPLPEELKELP